MIWNDTYEMARPMTGFWTKKIDMKCNHLYTLLVLNIKIILKSIKRV